MPSAESIRHFEDLPLLLEARVPCEPLSVSALAALEPGSILRTSRAAGESVDITVSDQAVALAELIVIENRLAVRLSDLTENK